MTIRNEQGWVAVLYSEDSDFATGREQVNEMYRPTKESMIRALYEELIEFVLETQKEPDKKWSTESINQWKELIKNKYPEFAQRFGVPTLGEMAVTFIKPGTAFTIVNRCDFDNHGYGEVFLLAGIMMITENSFNEL